jgi:hypothetical protein
MSKKTYQIWHDRAWPGRDLITEMTGETPQFPDDYVHVANVRADRPEKAVGLTVDHGGIPDDPRPWSPWERNEGVEALVRRARDTGPGDVVVGPEGRAYSVTENGLEALGASRAGDVAGRLFGAWHEEPLRRDDEDGPITGIRKREVSRQAGESERDEARARKITDFRAAIEEMKRDGVPAEPPLGARRSWAEAAETEKLDNIVFESWKVSPSTAGHGQVEVPVEWIGIPGIVALETVEREVDPAGLHPAQGEMLRDLRARINDGAYAATDPAGKDGVGMALARIVGVGEFEREVAALKHQDGPWAELPEAGKVRGLVDLAVETGPPGAYALEVIAREVDPGRLPDWRREPLRDLLNRVDRGELDGENPNPLYQEDRAGLALRLVELEARIEDLKHAGHDDPDPGRYRRWEHCLEEVKCRAIMEDVEALGLRREQAAYEVLAREVNLREMPAEEQRHVETVRAEAWPPLDSGDRGMEGRLEEIEAGWSKSSAVGHELDVKRGREVLAGGADLSREALLRETHQLFRDLGYLGFRGDYFNDPDSIAEWPDPGVRERELRALWDSQAEGSFAGFRESYAHERTEMIITYRDYLRDLSQADENTQRGFYKEISALGRGETIDKDGRGINERVTEISEGEDEIPTGEAWRKLQAELTHDYGLRRMEDRGVKYEDEVERMLDHAAEGHRGDIVERARRLGGEDVEPVRDRDRPTGPGR